MSFIKYIRLCLTHLHGFELLVPLPQFIEITFTYTKKDQFSESKVKFRQASNCCEIVLEPSKITYSNKRKDSINSQKLGSQDFSQIANSALKKAKSAIPLLFNGPEVSSSASNKAKLFTEDFCQNSDLNDSGISLLGFPSRTNLRPHNICNS